MHRWLISILFVFTGFAVAVAGAFSFFSVWQAVWTFGIGVALFLLSFIRVSYSSRVLLFGLSLFPLLGSGMLVLLSFFVAFSFLKKEIREKVNYESALSFAAALYFFVVLGSLISSLDRSIDFYLLYRLTREAGASAFLSFVRENAYFFSEPLSLAGAQLLLWPLVLIFRVVLQNRELIKTHFYWLLAGAFSSGLFVFAQKFEFSPYLSANYSDFWRFTQRMPAGYSDPNAYAIFIVLVLPFVPFLFSAIRSVFRRRFLLSLAYALLLLPACYSGSRTLLVGTFLYCVLLFGRSLRAYLLLFCFTFVLSLALFFMPQENLPRSFVRLAQTVKGANLENGISSRLLFSRLALEHATEAPFFGSGVASFSKGQVRAAKRLDLDLGPWRDNANNFYLHTLVEAGLFGLSLLVFAISYLLITRRRLTREDLSALVPREFREAASLVLGVFLVLLLLGPHLLFSEILALVSFLLVCVFAEEENVSSSSYARMKLALLCLLPLSYMLVWCQEGGATISRGFYPLEGKVSADSYRWTTGRVYFSKCEKLLLDAPRADLMKPLELSLEIRKQEGWKLLKVLPLEAGSLLELDLNQVGLEEEIKTNERFRLSVDRSWVPAGSKGEGDFRSLGIRVRSQQEGLECLDERR